MHLICHYLIWWPQVSHLASGPQRESHSVSKILQTPTSCAGGINLPTATLAQNKGLRAHASWTLRQTLHFIKQRTLLSTLQTLKRPRFVTWWPQVKFFDWNIEDFKRGSHALCDPHMTIKEKRASLSRLGNFSLAATVVWDFENREHTHFRVLVYSDILPHWGAFKISQFRWGQKDCLASKLKSELSEREYRERQRTTERSLLMQGDYIFCACG